MNRAGGHKEEEERYAGYALDDGEERRRDRRSLFLIDGHRIISGWPGRSRSTMVERAEGREEEREKGGELNSRRDRSDGGIPRNTVWTHEGAIPETEASRRPGALPSASSFRIRGLSHAVQRALLLRISVLLTLLSLSLFRFPEGARRRHSARRPQHGQAITCRYWSLIGAPDPSVDMPIIGLP